MIEYRTVNTMTIEGIEQAERLKAAGWKQGSVGMFTVQYYREKPKRKRKKV